MRATLHAALFCWAVALAAGCGGRGESASDTRDRAPATGPEDHAATGPGGAAACPLTVAGTTGTVEDTVDGIVLVFTTTPAGVPELRARVDELAEQHNGALMPAAPPAVASTETSAGGARLVLRPLDAAHIDNLRDPLRKQADAMLKRTCDRETRPTPGAT